MEPAVSFSTVACLLGGSNRQIDGLDGLNARRTSKRQEDWPAETVGEHSLGKTADLSEKTRRINQEAKWPGERCAPDEEWAGLDEN